MKVLLIPLLVLFVISAGGKPLDKTVVPQILTHEQKLLLASQLEIREKMMLQTDPDSVANDLLRRNITDYDPEYAQILSDIDRRHSLYKLTHRDLQWHTVAKIMQNLNNDDRVELIKNVRRYPLHRRLPATIAISPHALGHWHLAKKMFLNSIKKMGK